MLLHAHFEMEDNTVLVNVDNVGLMFHGKHTNEQLLGQVVPSQCMLSNTSDGLVPRFNLLANASEALLIWIRWSIRNSSMSCVLPL